MKKEMNEIENKLIELKEVPSRNAIKARSGRSQFTGLAEKMKHTEVKLPQQSRWWQLLNVRTENLTMKFSMKLITILVLMGLFLGATGLSVVAAQTSMPGEVFYPLKMLVEDIQLNNTSNNEVNVNLALKFANRRYSEITQLLEEGLMPPDPVVVRWQNHILSALQNALEADDSIELLETVRTSLQKQSQMMSMLKLGPTTEPWMNQFHNQLKNQIGLVEAGLNDPVELAKELQWMNQYKQQLQLAGESDQWQWMFQHQNQNPDSETQYQWQYQNQRSDQLLENDQNRKNQNQENNQNNPVEGNGENIQNNENEQNGNAGSNGNQTGTQNNAGNGDNGGSGGGGNGGK